MLDPGTRGTGQKPRCVSPGSSLYLSRGVEKRDDKFRKVFDEEGIERSTLRWESERTLKMRIVYPDKPLEVYMEGNNLNRLEQVGLTFGDQRKEKEGG